VLSLELDTISRLSGEKATPLTQPEWPRSVCKSILQSSESRRMPSHVLKPRVDAAPPSVVGLIYTRCPVAATSLSIVVIVTTTISRALW
jgi:hypothetical protein